MTKRALLFAVLGLASATGAQAQLRLLPVRVVQCRLSDSLLGGGKPDGHVVGVYDSVRNATMLGTEPERIWQPGFGLRGITGSARFEGREPSGGLVVQLDLRIVEPTERTIDQRQLLLVLDDSTRVDLGSMSNHPQRIFQVPGVTQNMSVILPMAQLYALARATRVRGTIGSTRFDFTRDQHRNFRTLYIALVCGMPSNGK
jgi:hypothetical protein